MNYKLLAIIFVAGLATGAYITNKYKKPVVEQKTVYRNQTRTITRTVKLPSGRVETVVEAESNTTNTSTVQNLRKNWLAGASISTESDLKPIYGVHVERRILGPAFLGLDLRTNGQVGLLLSIEF